MNAKLNAQIVTLLRIVSFAVYLKTGEVGSVTVLYIGCILGWIILALKK